MSWSFTFEAHADPDTFGNEAGAAYAAAIFPTDQIDQGRDAIESAIAAAVLLVGAGVVGDATRVVRCTLSGHANKDHAPMAGWSNDTVTISLYQLT